MTPIRSCMAVDADPSERPLRERRKAVLTCPACTHTSLVEGDWRWVPREHGTEVRCPVCYELLTVRDQFDEGNRAAKAKERSK